MNPIDAVLEIARSEGVDRVFGNPGTTEVPFTDALGNVRDLEYVLGLHECSVVAMADGYARATRRPALVNLHVAAGVANGLIGMLNAWRSRTPMVVTAGQQDRRHLAQDPMLSADLVGMAGVPCKDAVEVQHVRDLPVVMRRAFALAEQPPAGPVFVSLPVDLLEEPVDLQVPERSTRVPLGAPDVTTAVEVLEAARRPAIVAGDGVGRSDATAALVTVAEVLGASVYDQPMSDGINFPQSHGLYAGMLMPTSTAIRKALDQHDVVLIVGCHAFMAHHYTPGSPIPDGLTVVQVDDDAAEIGRNFAVAAGLVGSLPPTLTALGNELSGQVGDAQARTDRLAGEHLDQRRTVTADAEAGYGPVPLPPLTAAQAVAAGLPEDAVVVEEAITTGLKLRQVLHLDRPRSYVHTVGGGLGWGIGAAIGSRMGDPSRPVVAVLGDGCALFGIQGLWSAAHYDIPATFVVMDNAEYRTLKETTDHNRAGTDVNGRYIGLDIHPPRIDWAAAGQTFGVDTHTVESADDLAATIADAERRSHPLLVHVPIHPHSGP